MLYKYKVLTTKKTPKQQTEKQPTHLVTDVSLQFIL